MYSPYQLVVANIMDLSQHLLVYSFYKINSLLFTSSAQYKEKNSIITCKKILGISVSNPNQNLT